MTVRKQSIAAPSSSFRYHGEQNIEPDDVGSIADDFTTTDQPIQFSTRIKARPQLATIISDEGQNQQDQPDTDSEQGLSMSVNLTSNGKVVSSVVETKMETPPRENTTPVQKRPLSPPLAAFLSRRPRAPKLSALRARGGAFAAGVLNRTSSLMTASLDSSAGEHSPTPPSLRRLPARGSRLVHQPSDASSGSTSTPTPKRKCSFSSFSECRLLEGDGERHQTFLFSIEAPSPPPSPTLGEARTPQAEEDDSSLPQNSLDVPGKSLPPPSPSPSSVQPPPPNQHAQLTASQRRRRFSQSSLSAGTTATWTSSANSSTSLHLAGNELEANGGLGHHHPPLSKSGSLLSMTSQVRFETLARFDLSLVLSGSYTL